MSSLNYNGVVLYEHCWYPKLTALPCLLLYSCYIKGLVGWIFSPNVWLQYNAQCLPTSKHHFIYTDIISKDQYK